MQPSELTTIKEVCLNFNCNYIHGLINKLSYHNYGMRWILVVKLPKTINCHLVLFNP